MQVYVQFADGLDARQWRERHARLEVPDVTPYGLHHLADAETTVSFNRPPAGRWADLRRRLQGRAAGQDWLAEAWSRHSAERRGADVVFCMDERAGFPAALTRPSVPVVSGIAWVEHRAQQRSEPLVERALHRLAAYVVFAQEHIELLARDWGLDPARGHVARFGIDPDFFPATPYDERSPGGLRVFSVGDDRMRDFDTLVDAARLLDAAGTRLDLEIATTRPVELPAHLGRLLPRRLGPSVREHVAACAVAVVAVHPNVLASGLTATLEAMAMARPVVVSDVPGMRHYVEDGVTGLLVPPADPVALAEAVAQLLGDPVRARRMGEDAARRVRERFTTPRFAADLRSVLHDVVQAGSPVTPA